MIVIWCQFINISFLLLSISVLRNVPSRLLLQRSKASPAVSYPVTGQDLIRYAQTGMPVQILADLLRIGHRDTPELRRLCGLFTRDQPDRYQVSAFSGLLEGKEIWKKKLIHILSFLYNSVLLCFTWELHEFPSLPSWYIHDLMFVCCPSGLIFYGTV